MYDYLIVGSGLFGAICAHELKKANKSVLVIDKRSHIGGNIYTKNIEGINVHVYGAHIFHTSNKEVWDYVNNFATFNNYINSPVAKYHDEIYNLPFNMNTFSKIWPDAITPEIAKMHIEKEKEQYHIDNPSNLEEQAINLVGKTIYEKLIKEYTEKQWGQKCSELPAFIIKRLPVRFIYDNNYFNDTYQGIPIGGYTKIIEKLLDGVEVRLNTSFDKSFLSLAKKVIYTGCIDEFFDYKFGKLEYRTVSFVTETLDVENYQGCAVVNYTSHDEKFTRIIEHKHFEKANSSKTIISKEYSKQFEENDEPYYPINNERNNTLYEKYKEEAKKYPNVVFGGRLGQYKYYDMDKVVLEALNFLREEK